MYFYFAHISKWQEVLGSFLSIKKIDFSFYFLCILICFSYFLYLFSLGLILIISSVLFSKSLFQWPWLICYWTFYWIFNFNYGISHLQKFFFLKSACCLITISKLSSIYWNVFNILFHIVVLMILVFEVIEDLILLFYSFGFCSSFLVCVCLIEGYSVTP